MSEEMKPEEQRPEEEQKPEQPGRGLYEWAQALVCSVLAAVVLFAFAVRVVGVSGGSMRNTLQNGDLLLVVNSLLCGDYQRGDVVIAAKDSFEHGEPIVKRVIATEGQTVDVDFDGGVVYVDGAALEEPYILEATHRLPPYRAGGLCLPHGGQPERKPGQPGPGAGGGGHPLPHWPGGVPAASRRDGGAGRAGVEPDWKTLRPAPRRLCGAPA